MINVLEFSLQWGLGGTGKNSQTFMKYFNRERFNVFAAGWHGGEREITIRGMGIELFVESDRPKMVEWIKSKKIDIVHFYRRGEADSDLINTFVSAEVPILIEHNCFAMLDKTDDRNKINKHLVCSKTSVEMYKRRSGQLYEQEKVTDIYCPTETLEFGAYNFNRDWDSPVFGRHSRKDPYKWHLVNIHILPLIRKEFPNAKMHAIGLPDEFRQLIKYLEVEDMIVEFPPPADDNGIMEFLNGINVFTHGSFCGESFGNTIAEAMSSGLPVITHAGGDAAQTELITDGFNGFVVEFPDNAQTYADKLIELFKNPEKKKEMGLLGKQRANEWFEASLITRKLEDIFEKEYSLWSSNEKT